MSHRPAHWRKIVFVYIFQLFSYATSTATSTVLVQLIAPSYVTYGNTVALHCNHSVSDDLLHKVEFMKDDKRILQYIKDRKPPFVEWRVEGANMEYLDNGTTIKLTDVRFEASGSYICQVSMAFPIYTEASDPVQMKVIVPQTENPKITFKKSMYVVGESLEANCTSSAAHPVPHLTWFINGKEVDITLVNHYPHTRRKDQLMSATAKLMIEVSALHAGENGYLEISCYSTIPSYPVNEQYADIRKETVSVQIIPAPIVVSSALRITQGWTLPMILYILCATRKVIP
ncbi:cell adhesion molecule 1 [Augochlora pura]